MGGCNWILCFRLLIFKIFYNVKSLCNKQKSILPTAHFSVILRQQNSFSYNKFAENTRVDRLYHRSKQRS